MQIKVLLIDDSVQKIREIRSFFNSSIYADDIHLDVGKSVRTGIKLLQKNFYDLLLIDLLLPFRDGETPQNNGGLQLLTQIKIERSIRVPDHIVGITAFSDLGAQYSKDFNENMWFIIQFENHSNGWQKRLEVLMAHLAAIKRDNNDPVYDFDIAIITALHSVELEAVLELDANWKEHKFENDSSIYHRGKFEADSNPLRVVASSATEMGMCAATSLSMKMIEHFRPRYLVMLGIAAGVEANIGDILVAEQSWDYGSGKHCRSSVDEREFLPAPSQIQLDNELKSKIYWFKLQAGNKVLRSIADKWTQHVLTSAPKMLIGPIASGAAVIQDRKLVSEIAAHNRKLIGVEMEVYGVFHAALNCTKPRPKPMAFKSVCDSADSNKNDEDQPYAAFTSAQLFYEFARDKLRIQEFG